jgi:hypothetical protein
MTLADIKRLDSPMLTPAQAATILGCSPATLRWQAHRDKETLGFDVTVMRNRVYIPRKPFIEYIEGKEAGTHDADAS